MASDQDVILCDSACGNNGHLDQDNCGGRWNGCVVYLDFWTDFDSVPHHRLLLKLEAHSINGNLSSGLRASSLVESRECQLLATSQHHSMG